MLSTILVAAYGCKSTPTSDVSFGDNGAELAATYPDFETDAFFKSSATDHAIAKMVSGTGVTAGDKAIQVDFESVSDANKYKYWPNVKFFPESGAWNWNSKGSLKVDVTNPTDKAANIIFKLVDNVGQMGAETNQLNYAVNIPAGETQTVEMLFNGGLRKLDGYWNGDNLNLRKLAELQVFVQGPIDAQTIILDNLELVNATGDFISAEEQVIDVGPVPTIAAITNFENGEKTFVSKERSNATAAKVVKTTEGAGLEVDFFATNAYPNITFMPEQPWDWSKEGDFNLAFDIENPTDDAVQMFVRVDQAENSNWGGTADGVKDSMSSYMTLLPGKKSTYYMSLRQLSEHVVSGMRSEPPKLSYDAQAISWGWGESNLDIANIHSVQLYLQNPTKDSKIVIDSIRLVPNLDADTSRYTGIVDKYGQFTGDDWEEKIHSDEQLKSAGQEALANLGNVQPMADRCKFGGWKDGPRLEATGFFRTEKVDDKWTLVDPEGCMFFMTGLDNVRMDDTVTITGIDFDDPKARQGGHLASKLRHSMFEWLPEDDDPLAANYGYAGYVHSGALKQGEVFSFYRANLMRKYDTDKESAMKIWKDVTLDRMVDWGFTTLGNWIDPMYFGSERVAYEAHGWIYGDHKRISTGNDYWGPIHDPFDPEFKNSARDMANEVASRVKDDDQWLVGVFVDNEISWGNVMNEANHFGLIVNALSYDVKDSPAKNAFSEYLKSKYSTVSALNAAWGSNIASWAEFDRSYDYRASLTSGMRADYSDMLQMLSEQYFSIVRTEIKHVLPNHLYLGARFADWGVTPEIARGAAKYVDVMSYNLYANDLNDGKKAHWKNLLPEFDKPSVIGEFHFGAVDTGLFHGGIVTVSNQKERAEMYTNYMDSIVENPYFVGAHWFQYLDSPATGRAWDGENYNIGFVTIADEPYVELIEAAKQFNADLYTKRFGK
ncbi:beta-galactosidase [Thaumasiovibrio sp. DFM-14]|uniref:beta-galactosidase n=1 Tax=Thaumasiovibrio sp. DFM-14 TaxID=3384792 RepID=UPI0039A15E68